MNDSDFKFLTSLLATMGTGAVIKMITGSDTLGVIALVLMGLYIMARKKN
jgi:uncharacterized membrane protein (Fun14 family)